MMGVPSLSERLPFPSAALTRTAPTPARCVDCPSTRIRLALASTMALLAEHRAQLRDLVVDALAGLDERQQGAGLYELIRGFPELLQVPELADLASRGGVVSSRPPELDALELDDVTERRFAP